MSAPNLIRSGGLATMLSGVLFLAFPFLFFSLEPYEFVYVVAMVVALLLVPVGMVGFHLLQGRSYGREALLGFWLVVVGALVMLVGGVVFFTLGKSGDFAFATPPTQSLAARFGGEEIRPSALS